MKRLSTSTANTADPNNGNNNNQQISGVSRPSQTPSESVNIKSGNAVDGSMEDLGSHADTGSAIAVATPAAASANPLSTEAYDKGEDKKQKQQMGVISTPPNHIPQIRYAHLYLSRLTG